MQSIFISYKYENSYYNHWLKSAKPHHWQETKNHTIYFHSTQVLFLKPVGYSWGHSRMERALNNPVQGGDFERIQMCTWAPWDKQDPLHMQFQQAWSKPFQSYPDQSELSHLLPQYQSLQYPLMFPSWFCRFKSFVLQGPVTHCLHQDAETARILHTVKGEGPNRTIFQLESLWTRK